MRIAKSSCPSASQVKGHYQHVIRGSKGIFRQKFLGSGLVMSFRDMRWFAQASRDQQGNEQGKTDDNGEHRHDYTH